MFLFAVSTQLRVSLCVSLFSYDAYLHIKFRFVIFEQSNKVDVALLAVE